MIRLTDQEFLDVVEYFRKNYGINLKNKKILIECRMAKELERCKVSNFGDYLKLLKKDSGGDIAGGMVNRLTTNYTYFLREPAHFTLLEEQIFSELLEKKRYGPLYIWCAGCATGEECYTLAMCMNEYQEKNGCTLNARIIATDISEEVLEKAEKGVYPKREIEDIPPSWQEKYCREIKKNSFCVAEELKYNIRFMKHNLMEPLKETGRFDMIFCRNVMIYFDKFSRQRLVSMLEENLNPGGYLFIGHAELLARDETNLEQVHQAVYRKRETI
ncbi:MAG: protein-glutamate O-methyltransferase CheR [Faecalicatena sp.]|uniref:CheR family methyltransferase n=1 Tax=Faecalicatena sp. TaxID=2005360 RepID=UPI00258D0A75|nr:protein-glutamate O-methyltransferase CheR [Faecalicatena sp.]MCI6465291.1 protein-glutamate O-methyltransferase CheR [Faecalicatena sp.]MDY5617547.1 protein-glutamate O-methyltransferase CheR [Lachnospiraceae bacterium]